MSALQAERLAARYPGQPPALVDIDLAVQSGERLLLLGPNGAGKSTFIRLFAGLMRAAAGAALISGRPARDARSQVGVVTHATLLYDELTAAENLRLYAALYGIRRERAADLLEIVGLAHLADRPVGRLSRGQQQRVAIARALIHDPPVLLLDEPDTGLDAAAFDVLEALVRDRTVVLTTHNLAAGVRLSTRAAILAGGRLVYEEPQLSNVAALAERLDSLTR